MTQSNTSKRSLFVFLVLSRCGGASKLDHAIGKQLWE